MTRTSRRQRSLFVPAALASAAALFLAGCGGGGDYCSDCGGGGPGGTVTSYVGTQDAIAAWADPSTSTINVAPAGEYAGKRQLMRGTVSPYTGDDLGQPAGVEIYEFSDGYVHLLDLADVGFPVAVQVSSESHATIDAGCTGTGVEAIPGSTSTDYNGTYFAGDLSMPTNSTYVYRLPGTDGSCNTSDDVIHAVRTGMSATDAPLTAAAMPAATVYSSAGAVTGYIAKSGNTIVKLDGNLATPTTLATYSLPLQVLEPLPVGQVSGYETGRLYIADGDIVFIDYAAGTVSSSLFTIPGWSATDDGLQAVAASPSDLYFAVYTAGAGGALGSTDIYQMSADGSTMPALIATLAGRVTTMEFPVGGDSVVVGVQGATTWSIVAFPEAGGLPTTVLLGDENTGRFTATASDVYFTEWNVTGGTGTSTRSGMKSGISGLDGSVVMAPMANSLFMNGGEAVPWTNGDVTTQRTPLQTVFQVTGLSQTGTSTNPVTHIAVTAPTLTGGSLVAISTTTNATIATLGTFGTTSATALSGTIHAQLGHWFFVDASNAASTAVPGTHDVYLVNSQTSGSMVRASNNL